jgi:DNA repair exonuclease SbcCD nuclease subunit
VSKVAIITDTHFGARGDSDAMQRSQQKYLERIFFPALDRSEVRTVLHGGDFGDRRKYINYATARFIHEQWFTPLHARGIRQHILVGNHDAFLKHSNHINSVEELYRDTPGVTSYANPTELEVDGCLLLLLPWICDENRDDSLFLIHNSPASLVLGHLELTGFQMHRGQVSLDGLDPEVFNRFKMVMSGHYHHKSTKHPIEYLGAPWPMIWSDYNDARGSYLFDTETHDLTYLANPYSLFTRLLYDDAGQTHDYIHELVQTVLADPSPFRESYVKVVVRTKEQPYWFDLLMDALYKVNALDVLVVDDIIVNEDDSETPAPVTDADTLTLMREYVDALSISCDRQDLTRYLDGLYHEAVTANQAVRFS